MLFEYSVMNTTGARTTGQIDAASSDLAVENLQKRGFIVISIRSLETTSSVQKLLPFLNKVPLKEIVIMSRQIASLFDAQVSAVKGFSLMAESTTNVSLKSVLESVSQDIQSGITIADAMSKHQKVFSDFYVNMVRAGEESGKLTDTFNFLADYLERQYELTSKTKNALIYPAFVVFTFITVIVLMMTLVIPKLTQIITESGQEIPIYTKIVIGMSNVFVNYGFILLIAVILMGVFIGWQLRTDAGKTWLDRVKINIPYIGNLFTKMYLSRISDNLSTMLAAGIPIIRTLEITRDVVGNKVYERIIANTIEGVKGGSSLGDMFKSHAEIPSVLTQMVQVGQETGSLSSVLKKIADYYKREVESAVDTLIGLIEPAMIIVLGVSVGFLLMSVLVPIYNIAQSIQ